MNNIESILKKIADDANAAAQQKLDEANAEAQQILKDYQAQSRPAARRRTAEG